MKNGIFPECGSNEVLGNLRLRGGKGHPPFVDIREPEPENRPFVWMFKSERSHFCAYTCGAYGYTEFYAENCSGLNDGRRKGCTSG